MRDDSVDEGLAWEITPRRAPRPRRTWAPRMGVAVRGGFRAGFLPGILVMAIYYIAHHDVDLPWLKIATLMSVYAPGVGISLAAAIEAVVLLVDGLTARAPIVPRGPAVVVGCGLAGAACGIAPGAIGVVVFGSYRGPFIGTSLIATSMIIGAFLVALPAARRAARSWRAVVIATIATTLLVGVVASVVTPLVVDGAFGHMQGVSYEHGVFVGGAVGALGGCLLGGYAGLVIALARVGSGERRAS
ncbi:MAG: hypothetical protein NT062_29420 [Proteobacteria bacterium]|nr:hypothetical protein [Pseudomonadota bacterium]